MEDKDREGEKVMAEKAPSTSPSPAPVAKSLRKPRSSSPPRRSKSVEEPSMTFALFLYWIVPVMLFAVFSRQAVDTEVKPIDVKPSGSVVYEKKRPPVSTPSVMTTTTTTTTAPSQPSPAPAVASNWPTAYQEVAETIKSRRRRIEVQTRAPSQQPAATTTSTKQHETPTTTTATTRPSKQQQSPTPPGRRGAVDPMRNQFRDRIASLKREYEQQTDNLLAAITYADAMRLYDVRYHDGGSYERESMAMYEKVVEMAVQHRQKLVDQGLPTDESLSPSTAVKDEVTLDYSAKSADGLLCGVYTGQGKTFFMANFFEKAVESYSKCLEIEPGYLDAVNARGSALIILGRYAEAGRDLVQVVKEDENRVFTDSFQGLARVLQAKEDAVEGGWEVLVETAEALVPRLEGQLAAFPNTKQMYATSLARMYHALFLYHDVKTKDPSRAFDYLTNSYKHKMSLLPQWQKGSEMAKIEQAKRIFVSGFWPAGVGSSTNVPIFIVGFVRSGSTLLERVLDSHPLIAGTGENSVFNGRLPDIRNQIVRASVETPETLVDLTKSLADGVVDEMRSRWGKLHEETQEEEKDPLRLVDKMLTNYYNIGFLEMLMPNALILHVVREPMDTIFSAYKHDFPSGTLDYTSDFAGLSELYLAYRDMMDHWDTVLPGRVTHVRYEDMVHDMPGVARAIIAATGLPWDDSVLDFHKKKHAVNTLSTTQVRKGVYKDSLKSWMRYEKELQPLVKMLGDRVKYDLKTSLPGYQPPQQDDPKEE